jgi:DNA-directed RNA polymerase specialized sigma24 family protein
MTAEDYKSLQGFVIAMTKTRSLNEDERGDILQGALTSLIEQGIDPMSEQGRSWIVIHILRFVQQRARKYKTKVKHPVGLSDAQTLLSKEKSPVDGAILSEEIALLDLHIAALPPSLCETITMHRQGFSTTQIAEWRGVANTTVAKDRCRAVKMLQDSYGLAHAVGSGKAVDAPTWDYDGRVWVTGE